MFKKKKNKIEEETLKKMGIYLIITAIVFLTILLIYCIYMIVLVKGINDRIATQEEIELNDVVASNDFTEVTINTESYYLNNLCSNGCYFTNELVTNKYYYQIEKGEYDYTLSIYSLYKKIDSVELGTSIENLNINYYDDYILFENNKNDNTNTFDEYIFFNGDKTDVFDSNGLNEIELSENGVKYYSVVCKPEGTLGAYRIGYLRKPFTSQVTILSIEDTTSSKC